MNYKSIQFQILFAFILMFTASIVCSQVEELPEDRVSATGDIHPSAESDECKARAAAIVAVPPAQPRPDDDYAYERELQHYQQMAGDTPFDEKTYTALVEKVQNRTAERNRRIPQLERKIDELQQDLADAKNQFTNQKLIQELQTKLDSARSELQSLRARIPEEDLYHRMSAAQRVLELKRDLDLLARWKEFEKISELASRATDAQEKELNSLKALFEKEKARFTQEFNALKQQSDRSEETLQKGRDLKLESAKIFTNLKNRLQKFICWPEVQQFDQELENVIARLRKSKTSLLLGSDFEEVEDLPEDGNPFGNEEQKPPATGFRWILESTTPTPATAPQGWNYSSGSASLKIYNGDSCTFSWTPPPQQIDSNGFSVSLNVQCKAGNPGATIAGSLAASGSGVTYDSANREAYASGTGSAGATKSVAFKPVQGSSAIEIHISIQWGIDFKYMYRREN